MARPSVADERREQIIEATLRTISEHGISGTTLDRIADAAGMSRGHVRHFVGNRDRLLLDTARAFYADENGRPAILPAAVASLDGALDYLFGTEFAASSSENAIVLAFVELARSTPEIAEVLAAAYSSTRERLAAYIAEAKHGAPEAARDAAAQGVLSAALGNVFIGDFDRDEGRTARARAAVDALLAAL
ncbi:TetR/AcrR family transcriptional regulator [Leucobacter muris]|uniref:TetR/AcrR family transcriptional regulator n=1 Tax=Leucobacter muris TaxID=1935379 RepID=A0ABX5QGJ0_9MICO|nr:TetR/AcrR family transcriptional regulator [Leucobacter muris]QAB18214.1 TetR/AcrR family transcriptional regulator [Leucobacter muris]